MKAMDMVATAKLQKAKARLIAARPLFDSASRIIETIKSCPGIEENIYVKPRDEVKNTAYVVITSNRGLCGSYNAGISQKALSHMSEDSSEHILVVGTKGRDFFRRRGKKIVEEYKDASETALYPDAEKISAKIIDMYTTGQVDEVYLAYTRFDSVMSYTPSVVKILPLGNDTPATYRSDAMQYLPNPNEFLNNAMPKYMNSFIFDALLEANSSEQASRMISMNSATKNASEIIDDLTLLFNRKRQADITQEINEIVSGASVSK
jgi:F-type H+-transporting ATPase subunit gamma